MLNLSFQPRTPKVVSGPIPAECESRSFTPIFHLPDLGAEEIQTLVSLVESPELTFPCSAQSTEGRSVYAVTSEHSDWRNIHGIPGLKLKGAFGLTSNPSNEADPHLQLVLPSPTSPFLDTNHWHISLDEQLRLTPVASAKKGLNTLGLSGAFREMSCHNALAACDSALRGILVGRLESAGKPILDLNQQETGAVFIENDPDARMLWGYMHFVYMDLSADEAEIRLPLYGEFNPGRQHPLASLVDKYCYFMGRLGEIKSRAIFDGGVLRHSSHPGNFFWNERTDKVFQADHDTCLLSADLSPEQRGAQMLRDVCSTLQRLITDLSICAFSSDWKSYLPHAPSPFYPYLRGVFGTFVSDENILTFANRLQSNFSRFTLERTDDFLDPLAKKYREAFCAGDDGKMKNILTRWGFIHNPFLAISIRSVYDLCRLGSFPSGFVIPKVNEQNFFYDLSNGILALRDRIHGR